MGYWAQVEDITSPLIFTGKKVRKKKGTLDIASNNLPGIFLALF
jgi:hypothetical protein